MAQKFKPGDRVRILGPGAIYWTTKQMWEAEEQFNVNWQSIVFFGVKGMIKPRERPDHIVKEEEDKWWIDMLPQIVGKEGIIIGSYADLRDAGKHGFAGGSRPSGEDTYSISGIPEKQSWYDENQLELIT